jgi:hypothetical protein
MEEMLADVDALSSMRAIIGAPAWRTNHLRAAEDSEDPTI